MDTLKGTFGLKYGPKIIKIVKGLIYAFVLDQIMMMNHLYME